MYYSGRGVPLDYVTAFLWYSRAAAGGDERAARVLKQLATVMTPRQKQLAQARLAERQAVSTADLPSRPSIPRE